MLPTAEELMARRSEAAAQARHILSLNPVYLDTETTGTDPRAQVIEIGIMDSDGAPLINSLIRPVGGLIVPAAATAVHGITNADVQSAPTWRDVHDQIQAIVGSRPVVIYNAEFDLRLMKQTASACGLELSVPRSFCAMLLYAKFYGEWNRHRESFAWQRLSRAVVQCGIQAEPQAHRANGDNALTRLVILHMAGQIEAGGGA